MEQTAVEVLRITISSYKNTEINGDVMVNELLHLIDKHILEMEKQHIIDACYFGSQYLPYEVKDKSEQYYNETFKNK